jgi:hypothetical protein
MDYDDDVTRRIGSGEHDVVPVVPRCEVVAIPLVAVYGDVLLAGVRVDPDDGHLGCLGYARDTTEIPVVEPPLEHGAITPRLLGNGSEGVDEVGELGGTRAPTHRECALVATTIGKSVRAARGGAHIGTDDSDRFWLTKR